MNITGEEEADEFKKIQNKGTSLLFFPFNSMNKLNQIGQQLGKNLIKTGIEILKKSVSLNPTIISSAEIKKIINDYFPKANLVFLDSRYNLISWKEWLKIDEIIYDIVKKKYEKDTYDCDDKAYVHKYWADRIFGISQFIVHGHRYGKDGNWKDGHFWCAKVSDNKLYFLEPEGIEWAEVKKGEKIWLKEKEYRALTFEM